MLHEEHKVIVIGPDGEPAGSKPRREVDKERDIVHGVHVFLSSPDGSLFLEEIPGTAHYAGTLGSAAAGLLREGEGLEACASRLVYEELGGIGIPLELLGTEMVALGSRHLVQSVFRGVYGGELMENRRDRARITKMTLAQFAERIATEPSVFAPTFLAAWERYGRALVGGDAAA